MNCPQCRAENAGDRFRCAACGAWLREKPPLGVEAPSYLLPAILCTLFCCVPFGIVAIVYAAQATSKAEAGDVAGAQYSAEKARMWCWIAFWTQGAIWLVAVLGVMMLGLVRGVV